MKKRLDVRVLELGICESRERARGEIMAGNVLVGGSAVWQPGFQVKENDDIRLKTEGLKYVSRGGLKLAKAAAEFGIDFSGKTCADIGASTGGFTDYMLQNGAAKVYAIDVGYGQLANKLRNDARVVNMERVNARHLFETMPPFSESSIDIVTIDVSFISLKHIFPPAKEMLAEGGKIIALIKPQFEAGRREVGKGGIVRDDVVREKAVENVLGYAEENGLKNLGLTKSPILGAKGNIEYLGLWTWASGGAT